MISKLLTIALALCAVTSLTSCLSNTNRAARAQYERQETAAIWNEASRYGVYQQQYYPRAEHYSIPRSDGSFNTYTGVDRYGRRYYEGTSDPYGSRRLSERDGYPMISESSPADDRGYGSGGFIPTSPRSAVRDRPTFEGPPVPTIEKKKEEPAPEPKKKNFDNLPYATPVPGRSGFVTLKSHPNLPEIDVTGIAPGTPVEIPNPGKPGDTIQFRVP